MLEARHLDCIRGNQTLFMGLNCTVSRGEILHVQGPNGCGKTSLFLHFNGPGIIGSFEKCWRK